MKSTNNDRPLKVRIDYINRKTNRRARDRDSPWSEGSTESKVWDPYRKGGESDGGRTVRCQDGEEGEGDGGGFTENPLHPGID